MDTCVVLAVVLIQSNDAIITITHGNHEMDRQWYNVLLKYNNKTFNVTFSLPSRRAFSLGSRSAVCTRSAVRPIGLILW